MSADKDTPAGRGYRWPAEWELHRATWLSWPHNNETWPNGLGPVEEAFCEMVRGILLGEAVEISVRDAAEAERVVEVLRGAGIDPEEGLGFHEIPTDDAWVRDHGAIFLTAKERSNAASAPAPRLALDFEFDAWGGKYPPWEQDARVARAMAAAIGVPVFSSPYVLEAGAIEGDGEGTVLTTESCLLNPNRERPAQDRSRSGIEKVLFETLGAEKILWLGDGIEGDDTDGHIDDLTRFVAPGKVATILEADVSDPNAAVLAANRERLSGLRDAAGRSLEIIDLPSPGRIEASHGRLPASYANFYIANASVLVPVFGVQADELALGILGDCFPGRKIVPVASRALVEGLGAIHCLTQQEPARPFLLIPHESGAAIRLSMLIRFLASPSFLGGPTRTEETESDVDACCL